MDDDITDGSRNRSFKRNLNHAWALQATRQGASSLRSIGTEKPESAMTDLFSVNISIYVRAATDQFVLEPLDKVYGILALMPSELRDAVDVDYELPVSEVYAQFIKSCLKWDRLHALLAFVQPRFLSQSAKEVPTNNNRSEILSPSTKGLPSWCVDLSGDPDGMTFGGYDGLNVGFHAGFRKDLEAKCTIDTSGSGGTIKSDVSGLIQLQLVHLNVRLKVTT